MSQARTESVKLTAEFLKKMTQEDVENMSPEERAEVVGRLVDEGIRVSAKIAIALQGGIRSPEDVMSLSRDNVKPPEKIYTSRFSDHDYPDYDHEDPCVPSCGPYG